MDSQFEPIWSEFANINVDINTTSSSKHVPDIEHQICGTNEIARECSHTLPLKYLPKVIIFSMLMNCALWINTFLPKGRVSTSASPRTILIGGKFDYNKQFRLKFGQYAQVN